MQLVAYDHVGIRVTDAARSLEFYRALGFVVDEANSHERVAEVVSPSGVRLALIFNGVPAPNGENVLLDVLPKRPGYTHAAFVVLPGLGEPDRGRREGDPLPAGGLANRGGRSALKLAGFARPAMTGNIPPRCALGAEAISELA